MGKYDHDGRTAMWKSAIHRLADARALLRLGTEHVRGSAYLGGYAIECRLKAIAMEVHDCWTLRELSEQLGVREDLVFTHGLEVLLEHMPMTLRDNLRATKDVWRAWASQVNRWLPAWRYEHRRLSIDEGKVFLDAVEVVFNWLDANRA